MLVRQPAAGTWTAVLYTPQTSGFTGNVTLNTDPQRALPVGTVSGPTTIAPGDSKRVNVSLPVQDVGGDTSYTVSLGTSTGHQTAIPVVVRAVVPTSPSSVGSFAGTITGGNARAFSPAQTFSYDFDVPQGQQNLDVSVKLAGSAGDTLEGVLVDPNGETPSIVGNANPRNGNPMATMQLDEDASSMSYRIALIGPDVFGHGYGTEATRLVRDFAFGALGLHRLALEVNSFNAPAIAVYTKVGFVLEGVRRQAVRQDGDWYDVHDMSTS